MATSTTGKPWDRPNPKRQSAKRTMTDAEKAKARWRAEEAGRRYPNLVDNMAVLKERDA